jgi:iron complex outermembrane receptor protein
MKLQMRRATPALAFAVASLASIDVHPQAALAPVTITGKAPVPASVAGWGDTPLDRAPLQATAVDAEQIRDAGARRLSDLTRFDPSLTSAYDTEGVLD